MRSCPDRLSPCEKIRPSQLLNVASPATQQGSQRNARPALTQKKNAGGVRQKSLTWLNFCWTTMRHPLARCCSGNSVTYAFVSDLEHNTLFLLFTLLSSLVKIKYLPPPQQQLTPCIVLMQDCFPSERPLRRR